jgi:hypothetical protein
VCIRATRPLLLTLRSSGAPFFTAAIHCSVLATAAKRDCNTTLNTR